MIENIPEKLTDVFVPSPQNIINEFSDTIKWIKIDLEREKSGVETIYPIDFSEIYSILFPEFSHYKLGSINQFLLDPDELKIKFALFPPTIAEFTTNIERISKIVKDYKGVCRDFNKPLITNYVKKILDSKNNSQLLNSLNQKEHILNTLLELSTPSGLEHQIINPIHNFFTLTNKMKDQENLIEYWDIITNINQERFFSESSYDVYNYVNNRLQDIRGFDHQTPNHYDALMAQMTFELDKFSYRETKGFFSILTSSQIPYGILNQQYCKEQFFKGKPFNKTPIVRSPFYLLLKKIYLLNYSSDDLLTILEHSKGTFKVLEQINNDDDIKQENPKSREYLEKVNNKIFNSIHEGYIDPNNKDAFKALYFTLNEFFYDQYNENKCYDLIYSNVIRRFCDVNAQELIYNSNTDLKASQIADQIIKYLECQESDEFRENLEHANDIIKIQLKLMYDIFFNKYYKESGNYASPAMKMLQERITYGE